MIFLLTIQSAFSSVQSTGEIRTTYDYLPSFQLDEIGNQTSAKQMFRSRFRTGIHYEINPAWHLKAGIEVLNGQYAGTYSDVGLLVDDIPFRPLRSDNSELSLIWPTELYIQKKGEKIGYTFGVQSFQWGLGILSNDGYQQSIWGDAERGNQYLRTSVDVATGNFGRLFIAADSIVRDDNVSIYSENSAQQVIVGFMGGTKEGQYGVLVGHRWQQDRPDINHPESPTSVKAIPIDFYGTTQFSDSIVGEVELTHIRGTTNRIYSEQTRGNLTKIRSFGGLLRFKVATTDNLLHPSTALWELGFATGDANPTDDVSTTFYMHSNYNPGLILFEQVLPMLSANSLERLTEPELIGKPAPGLRYGINQGNVSNAWFVHFQDDFQFTPSLNIRSGYLFVRSLTPITDPFLSAMNGGYSVGYGNDQRASNNIGSELLFGLDYKLTGKNVEPMVRIDASWLNAHSEFTNLELDDLWTIHSKIQLRWGGAK